MGMAWGNFNINIEPLNWQRTICHLYGIVSQNISCALAERACISALKNSGC